MHINKLKVKNFRALENIEVDFSSPVSVIIGPNASGKTTVLEAIRVAKAVLAPRTQNEANQVLISLGAVSPHVPQTVFPDAITSRPAELTTVKCEFKVDDQAFTVIRGASAQLPGRLAQQNSGIQFSSQNQIVSYFASDAGKKAIKDAEDQVRSNLTELETRRSLRLNLTINWASGQIAGEYPVDQIFYSVAEQNRDPSTTLFSYFPADRAMPSGEQPVQLGVADVSAQLESYNSQPQTKFVRLKHTIFNSIVRNSEGRGQIEADFSLIFSRILKGRSLATIGVNELGLLSIKIKDNESGVLFDIDALSSGEKGLILTFLLISRSIAQNGLILLDEPELHLNPSVSRDVLQFMIEEFVKKRGVQAVICSHSAEILTAALEDSSCQLYHLRDGRSLARVRRHDEGEIRDALRRLGSSESEALLYRGTISVEGIHDAEILQSGFDDLFRRFRFRERGGRSEIEKNIKELQRAESRGDEVGYYFFLFDHDRKPTALSGSPKVRLMQLDRYCLENYLLDVDIITDLTREKEFSDNPFTNTTDLLALMKRLAGQQLNEVAARSVFQKFGLEGVCFDMSVLRADTAAQISVDLLQRIESMESLFASLRAGDFAGRFIEEFGQEKSRLEPIWDEKWREACDGKRLFEQLRKEEAIKGDLLRIKKRIALEMRRSTTEVWRTLESKLREFITIQG